MSVSEEIALYLLQIKAIKLSPQSPFTWASGIKSPIYCDNRTALSFPKVRGAIVEALKESALQQFSFDVIAGVATAGIPHGVLLADRLSKPFIYVRSKAKAHGRQNVIEGYLTEGAKVLVVEDLISTGGSSLQAVQALRDAGAVVSGVIAIFTYQFTKAQQAFNQAHCPYFTLSNYETLLKTAVNHQYINPEELALLQKWRENPEEWP